MAIARASLVRLALLALIWGSSFLWIAVALRGFSPIQIALARLTLGAAVLAVLVHARGLRLPAKRATWAHLSVAALFGNAIPYTLFAVGEQHVSSSVAGVLNTTTPLWTLAVAYASGHERAVSPGKAVGFAVGMAGTVVIFSPWQAGSQIASTGGLACLGAACSYGIAYVYMDRFLARRGIPPLVLSAAQLIPATAFLALVLPVAGFQPVHLRWESLAALGVLGILGTGIGYTLNYRLIADEGTTASVVTYLLPIVAVILGAVVLGDRITATIAAGMLIVLAGVAITHRAKPRQKQASKPAVSRISRLAPVSAVRRGMAQHPRQCRMECHVFSRIVGVLSRVVPIGFFTGLRRGKATRRARRPGYRGRWFLCSTVWRATAECCPW